MPETKTNKIRPHLQKEIEKKVPLLQEVFKDNPELVDRMSYHLQRVEDARIQRQTQRPEFDNLNYEEDYLLNQRAAYSYLRPKVNDSEVRIVGGTTEKKVEVIINELLALNLQHEVRAIDEKDIEIQNLGRDIGDIVNRTNLMEKDDDLRPDILSELTTQRAIFMEEIYEDISVTDKKRFDPRKVGITNQQSPNKSKGKTLRIQRPRKRIIPGINILLGDIHLPAYRFQDQPYLVKHRVIQYSQARQIFENYTNWKFVNPGRNTDFLSGVFDYRLDLTLSKNEVEILFYEDAVENEYQIYINSVPMLEVDTALPWSHYGYNTSMTIPKPIRRDFAYGKSPVAASKTIQALDDEMIRLLIRKFRQGMEPPTGGVGTGSIQTRGMWEPGAHTEGIAKENFSTLIDHSGVSQSDIAMYNIIEEKVKEFIGRSDISQGVETKGEKTAFEIKRTLEAGAVNLGLIVGAWIKIIRDMTELRIFNVIENEAIPIKKALNPLTKQVENVYKNYTIKSTSLLSGDIGQKTILFSENNPTKEQQLEIFDFEKKQKERGINEEIRVINVKKLRQIPMFFEIVVTSKPKNSSDLDKAMFNERLVQEGNITKLTGVPINPQTIIRDFEQAWDTKDAFQIQAPGQAKLQQPGSEEAQGLLDEIGKLKGTDTGEAVKQSEGVNPSLANFQNK